MASRVLTSTALLLSLNLLFFTLVTSTECPPPPKPSQPKPSPKPSQPGTSPNKPTPNPSSRPSQSSNKPSPSSRGKCPRDALELRLCANVLGGLVHVVLGPQNPCCTLVTGLVDLDAAVCLCTVIKADLLGIKLRVPVDLSVLLNSCGKTLPKDFQCA